MRRGSGGSRGRSRRVCRVAGTVVVIGVVLGPLAGCGGDDVRQSTAFIDARPTEFCAVNRSLPGDDPPEGYLGSERHRADLARLQAVAPAEIERVVERYRTAVEAGVVRDGPVGEPSPTWPSEVRRAADEIWAFAVRAC